MKAQMLQPASNSDGLRFVGHSSLQTLPLFPDESTPVLIKELTAHWCSTTLARFKCCRSSRQTPASTCTGLTCYFVLWCFCPQVSFSTSSIILPREPQHETWKTSSPSEALPRSTSCFSLCFHHYPRPSPLVTQEVSGASGASPATTTKANHSSAAAAFAIFHCKVGDFGNCGPQNCSLGLLWVFYLFYFLFFICFPPFPWSRSSVVTAGSL